MTGFGVNPEDLASTSRSLQAAVGALHDAAGKVQESTVSGNTVGKPFFSDGDEYGVLIRDVGGAVRDCGVRIEGIAHSLSDTGKTYGAIDSGNIRGLRSANTGWSQ